MESSLKAVPRWRQGTLPHQCGRQHFSRLAKPRYWVGNREHASGLQGGWCWRDFVRTLYPVEQELRKEKVSESLLLHEGIPSASKERSAMSTVSIVDML